MGFNVAGFLASNLHLQSQRVMAMCCTMHLPNHHIRLPQYLVPLLYRTGVTPNFSVKVAVAGSPTVKFEPLRWELPHSGQAKLTSTFARIFLFFPAIGLLSCNAHNFCPFYEVVFFCVNNFLSPPGKD
jgi:hypothetical protein